MWNSIKGILTQKKLDCVLLEAGPLEWEISTSTHSMENWPEVGKEVRIFTYLQHTEDQMKLFGFSTVQERTLFLNLLKVNGVGPKLALKILSGLKPSQIETALETGDTTLLSKTPGVGLKTAQKIILTLKGKLTLDEDPTNTKVGIKIELIHSLVEMGFDKKKVEKAVNQFWDDPEFKDLPDQEKEKTIFQKSLFKLTKEV